MKCFMEIFEFLGKLSLLWLGLEDGSSHVSERRWFQAATKVEPKARGAYSVDLAPPGAGGVWAGPAE
jgi:hypothetical protein